MKNKSVLIIPDVHGRTFWRNPVENALLESAKPDIVFLGDYIDPYSSENITPEAAIKELMAILAIKKKHPEQVHLLLGNHDMGYIYSDICSCRRDVERYALLRRLFTTNLALFDLAWETAIAGKRFLLTHAGIDRQWLEDNSSFFEGKTNVTSSFLNEALHGSSLKSTRTKKFMKILADVPIFRGGIKPYGSVVWADVTEFIFLSSCLDDTIQIFGHNQNSTPFCFGKGETPNTYCLDCREAFFLDSLGNVRYYSTGEVLKENHPECEVF